MKSSTLNSDREIKIGQVYRHFNGESLYEVKAIELSKISLSDEQRFVSNDFDGIACCNINANDTIVIYQRVGGANELYARSLENFNELVNKLHRMIFIADNVDLAKDYRYNDNW